MSHSGLRCPGRPRGSRDARNGLFAPDGSDRLGADRAERAAAVVRSWVARHARLRLRRGTGAATIGGIVRVLLVLMLVHGLAPGLAEIGESVVHYARTGHAAHTAADRGDLGDQGSEHGCGTTQHRCTCCATQSVAPAGEVVVASLDGGAAKALAPAETKLAAREPARPFRPPIS